jgi:hypothetical protein
MEMMVCREGVENGDRVLAEEGQKLAAGGKR